MSLIRVQIDETVKTVSYVGVQIEELEEISSAGVQIEKFAEKVSELAVEEDML